MVSALSNYAGRLVTLATWFFLTPYILGRLGDSDYGLYALIGSVTGYAALLDFGMTTAVTRFVAESHARRQPEEAEAVVATALSLYTGLAVLVILVSVLLAPWISGLFHLSLGLQRTAGVLIVVAGVGTAVSFPGALPYAVLAGTQRFDLASILSIVGTLATGAGIWFALQAGYGLVGVIAVHPILTLLMVAPGVILVRRAIPGFRFGWRAARRALVRKVVSFSSVLFVINVASQVQTKTDEIVIGAYLPIADITPYSIARRLSEIPQLLASQFVKILLPMATQLHTASAAEGLRSMYVTSTRLTVAMVSALTCGLCLLARPFISIWAGPQYADSARLLTVLAIAGMVDLSQWPASMILQGMGRHRLLAVTATATAAANLILSLWWIQTMGVMGVALGTLIPAIVESLFVVLPFSLKLIDVDARQAWSEMFGPALFPVGVMGALIAGLQNVVTIATLPAIAATGVLGIVAFLAMYLVQPATGLERQWALGVWRRMSARNGQKDQTGS